MTNQMLIATARATRVGDAFAPPHAPLAMPTQVLARSPGVLRRALRVLTARLAVLKRGFRRIG
jgi:hypothetical protein